MSKQRKQLQPPFTCFCDVCMATAALTSHPLNCSCRTCHDVSYALRVHELTRHEVFCSCAVCLDAAWSISEEAKAGRPRPAVTPEVRP